MHILMIAPEPFFEPRGTPFSEFHRIRALTTLGHTVDLVTYPLGKNVTLPGLTIHRSLRLIPISRIKIGPSWAKAPLDFLLACTAFRLALTRRYDAIHSHEEGGVIGVVLSSLRGIPHLYDMHSSLPQQVANFGYGSRTWLARVLAWCERVMIRGSRVVIVICPALESTVREIKANVPTVLIENAAGSGDAPVAGSGERIRAMLGLASHTPVIAYTGTFEAYQGLDLLFRSMVEVVRTRPEARLLMVGGESEQVDAARAQAKSLGIADYVLFAGQRPAEEVPAYLDAATMLVSPRSTGTNTPLKIYQYLRSGRPIVATRLLTHTQVLSDDTAVLAEPRPDQFAAAIITLIDDPQRAAEVGRNAKHLAQTKYSDEAFLEKTRVAYDALLAGDSRAVAKDFSARTRVL